MHQSGQPGNHRNFRIRIACQCTEQHQPKEDAAEGSSNIGRSVSRHNLTHVAILGSPFWEHPHFWEHPPFRDLKNKKSVHIATFLRLRTVALPSISNIGVKAQVIGRATTRFRFTGTKKSPQPQKSCKDTRFFVFATGKSPRQSRSAKTIQRRPSEGQTRS